MKNKQVKARFEGVAWDCWNYSSWVCNDLINGWLDYKDGDFLNGRDGQKYVSLTADQHKAIK